MTDRRPTATLIGEAPGPRNGRRVPLDGPSGARLDRLLGDGWREAYRVVNLLGRWPGPSGGHGSAWPLRAARRAASRRVWAGWTGEPLVILGRRCAAAMNVDAVDFFAWLTILSPSGRSGLAVVVPHPSGTSRWWNDPVNRESARINFAAIVARCAELGAR